MARVPAPDGDPEAPLQALIFDSVYNPFRGIEAYFRVMNGTIKKNGQIRFMATGKNYLADEIGVLKLSQEARKEIKAGDVGYLISGIKEAREVKVGDTITSKEQPAQEPISGLKRSSPWYLPESILSTQKILNISGPPWKSSSSMTPHSPSRLNLPRHWALVFAVVSSGCCTWRSCRSASNANSR